MDLITGDIFNYAKKYDVICIPTNGFVKSDGCCVMGRGFARYISTLYRGISFTLGRLIRLNGNIVQHIGLYNDIHLFSFPTKHAQLKVTDPDLLIDSSKKDALLNRTVPGWMCKSSIKIIEKSCNELVQLLENNPLFESSNILIPRPGCGNGQLDWSVVKPILDIYFFDPKFKIFHL